MELVISKIGGTAMLLMVVSLVLVTVSLFLPWFVYSSTIHTSETDTETATFATYREYLMVVNPDGSVSLLQYGEVYYGFAEDLEYTMDLEATLAVFWIVLGIGFVYSILRDDGALSIITGALIVFICGFMLFHFASVASSKAPWFPYIDGHEGFWGEGVSLYDSSEWEWGPGLGWFLVLAGGILGAVGSGLRVLLDGRE